MGAIAAAWNHPDTLVKRIDSERKLAAARAGGATPDELLDVTAPTVLNHTGSIERALGPNWRSHVEGYSKASDGKLPTDFGDDTKIVTVWKMTPDGKWYVVTCFPKP